MVLGERGDDVARQDVDHGVSVTARFDQGRRALPPLLRAMEAEGVLASAADVRVPTLDDVFLSLTGRSLREESGVAA